MHHGVGRLRQWISEWLEIGFETNSTRYLGEHFYTVKLLDVILTTIPQLQYFVLTTIASELLDDNVVTHVMCIVNMDLLDDFVVTCDERVVKWHGFVVISLRWKCPQTFFHRVTTNFYNVLGASALHRCDALVGYLHWAGLIFTPRLFIIRKWSGKVIKSEFNLPLVFRILSLRLMQPLKVIGFSLPKQPRYLWLKRHTELSLSWNALRDSAVFFSPVEITGTEMTSFRYQIFAGVKSSAEAFEVMIGKVFN